MAFFFWAILALGLALAVVFSSQLEFLVPAVAALAALLSSMIPGISDNWLLQTLIWLGVSGLGLLFFGRKLRAIRQGRRQKAVDPVAGRVATVVEAIPEGGEGRVRFVGTTWKAISAEAAEVGTQVMILGQEGIVLEVSAVDRFGLADELQALENQQNQKKGG